MENTFKLSIRLGNEAMQTPEDVATALEKIAEDLRNGRTGNTMFDENGNNVGTWGFL